MDHTQQLRWNRHFDSAWQRVSEALHRDLAQTKADLGLRTGQELNQHFWDTLAQAVGAEDVPPDHVPNMRLPPAAPAYEPREPTFIDFADATR